MEKLCKTGSPEEIISVFESDFYFSHDDAEKLFLYLAKTCEDKNIEEFGCISPPNPNAHSLIFGNGQYYINISKAILVFIALFLDLNLTKGIVNAVCGMLGISSQFFYKLNQEKGEVCVLREYLRNKNSAFSNDLSHLIDHECESKEINCSFRKADGLCHLRSTDIDETLQRLKTIGVI